MNTNQTLLALVIATSSLISGCASNNTQSSQPYPSSSGAYSEGYGQIDSIQIERANARTSGGGAVVGGLIGGVIGNQVGGGSGKAAATAAGVIGGAMLGNSAEKNSQAQARDVYRISVRLDTGNYTTITQDSISDLRVGDRVRVSNDRVYRN